MTKAQIEELTIPGKLPGEDQKPKLIETHISWVLLGSDFVFKIKKPIRYSFLDFSTPEKRNFYCHREIELNRRLSKGIYLDVLEIREESGQVKMGIGKGKVIDYAVRMKRLPAERQMNVLIEKSNIGFNEIEALALCIARFHQKAEIVRSKNIFQVAEEFRDLQNHQEYLVHTLGGGYGNIISEAINESDIFIHHHKDLLKERLAKGYYRDCHGDLHTRNIFFNPDPLPFDCIEFNDDFRKIDVLNEIAFLIMDLESYRRNDLAELFREKYNLHFPAIRTREEEKLLIYYKAYRTNVRAKVNRLRAGDANEEQVYNRAIQECKKYLDLLKIYTDQLK